MPKFVTFYGGPMAAGHNVMPSPEGESPEHLMSKIMAAFPAHRARLDAFAAQGKLLMVGTFADPAADGAMGIWRSKEDAEDFMREDPFQLQGLVRSWRLMEWNETQVP
jgi:uncharacterized protein YciI